MVLLEGGVRSRGCANSIGSATGSATCVIISSAANGLLLSLSFLPVRCPVLHSAGTSEACREGARARASERRVRESERQEEREEETGRERGREREFFVISPDACADARTRSGAQAHEANLVADNPTEKMGDIHIYLGIPDSGPSYKCEARAWPFQSWQSLAWLLCRRGSSGVRCR